MRAVLLAMRMEPLAMRVEPLAMRVERCPPAETCAGRPAPTEGNTMAWMRTRLCIDALYTTAVVQEGVSTHIGRGLVQQAQSSGLGAQCTICTLRRPGPSSWSWFITLATLLQSRHACCLLFQLFLRRARRMLHMHAHA
jgi:hypothetical protein